MGFAWVGVVPLLSSLFPAPQGLGIKAMDDLLVGKESGYVLWPEEYVAEGSVYDASWSASGKYVLGIRRSRIKPTADLVRNMLLGQSEAPEEGREVAPPPFVGAGGDAQGDPSPGSPSFVNTAGRLFLWSAADGTVIDLRRVPSSDSIGVRWMPESDFAVVVAGSVVDTAGGPVGSREVLLVDARKGTSRVVLKIVDQADALSSVSVEGLAFGGYSLLMVAEQKGVGTPDRVTQTTVRLIGRSGTVGAPIKLPATKRGYVVLSNADTKRSFLVGVKLHSEKDEPDPPRFHIDAVSNRLIPCSAADVAGAGFLDPGDEKPSDLAVRIDQTKIGSGASARMLSMAWLESQAEPVDKRLPTEALVAADCERAVVSRACNGVLYERSGALYARQIQKLNLDDMAKIAEVQERLQLMNRAKQVGLGILMYAADSDDVMPLSEGFNDAVMPYIKDANLLDGFVYTGNGADTSALEDPVNTEIGYIDGRGGRAVVYADGHVKWIKNK